MELKAYNIYKRHERIYITRLAPGKDNLIVSFDSPQKYFVVVIKKENEIVSKVLTNDKNVFITNLPEESELTVQIISGNDKSLERKFHTGNYLHNVINYVDKEEIQYDFSGNFLGSPSICEFKGKLWVTMDIFKNGGTKNNGHIETMLFVSENDGESWKFACDFVPAQWGRLFALNDTLYYYGANLTEYKTQIICSKDGYHWSESTTICENGTTSPNSIVINDKYVIFSMRVVTDSNDSHIVVARGDIKAGLMNPSSWITSNQVIPQFSWGGDQKIHYSEEGNAIEYDGEVYVLLRFAYKKALKLHYNVEKNLLEFDRIVDLEIGWCKFFIEKYNGIYYAMGNHTCFPRQIIKLYKSKDLNSWEEVKVINNITGLNQDTNGIQYPMFFFKNSKLYTVIRTALNGAETFHNSNAITFDKIDLD